MRWISFIRWNNAGFRNATDDCNFNGYVRSKGWRDVLGVGTFSRLLRVHRADCSTPILFSNNTNLVSNFDRLVWSNRQKQIFGTSETNKFWIFHKFTVIQHMINSDHLVLLECSSDCLESASLAYPLQALQCPFIRRKLLWSNNRKYRLLWKITFVEKGQYRNAAFLRTQNWLTPAICCGTVKANYYCSTVPRSEMSFCLWCYGMPVRVTLDAPVRCITVTYLRCSHLSCCYVNGTLLLDQWMRLSRLLLFNCKEYSHWQLHKVG